MPGWQDFTSLSQTFLSADLLLSDLSGILNTSLTYLPVIEHGIGGLSVSVTVQVAGVITVQVTDASGIVPTWTGRQTATAALQTLQFVVPYSYTTISALNVKVTSSVNQVHNSPTFIIGYGASINSAAGSQLLRADGRPYPIGANSAQVQTGAVVGTVIPAPGAGLHLMLLSMEVDEVVPGGQSVLGATVGGTAVNIHGGTTSGVVFHGWPSGLLLDANTPITVDVVGASTFCRAVIFYDVVP